MDALEKMHILYEQGFRQNSQASCGPASVILCAQSLGLEGKTENDWSAAFKKWLPLEDLEERGFALHELQFMSEMIYPFCLELQLRRAYPHNYDLFLSDLSTCFEQKKALLIVNFLQNDFIVGYDCPHGNPHYSPLLAMNLKLRELQIADVDPLVKTPYWVTVDKLFLSMQARNPALQLPRGWLLVTRI